jgi:hypothetical protein
MPFPPRQREIKAQCIGISFSTAAGISSPINCLIASKAISSLLKFSIVSKNQKTKVIVSGKYNPLSGANPCISASLKETLERYGLNCSISL